ncbi:hypothetical protein JTE90_023912 [Oedothorax gibbosus]|uniref:Uncharacterized protein n=1 Tax=Oedothorax gibbosus TaxID=931172 RepID=A0AAV6UNJ4_9ARAC|nr:hypothetical protein JTE90_023912 [Oedothorax gibbosus]
MPRWRKKALQRNQHVSLQGDISTSIPDHPSSFSSYTSRWQLLQTCILEAVAFGVPTSPPAQYQMEGRQPEPQPRRRGDSKAKGLRPCNLTSWDNRRRPSRFRLVSPGRHCKAHHRNLQATDHQVD